MTLTLLLTLLCCAAVIAACVSSRRRARARRRERARWAADGTDPVEVHWRTTKLPYDVCRRCGQRAHTDVHGEIVGHESCTRREG